MANLEELTNKIKTRLSQQNEILKECVSKYQNSQIENKKIAESIENITNQLKEATVHLKTIEQNHSNFVSATTEKQQQYEEQKKKYEKTI